MTSHPNLDQLNPEELRALAAQLIQRVETMDKQITHHKSVNEKLAHEIALLKRFKFAKHSEQLSPDQASLLDDLIDTDIAAIEAEFEALQPAPVEAKVRQQSARLNGHDPYAYLKDVLTRLPTQRASEIAELLPHRWRPV